MSLGLDTQAHKYKYSSMYMFFVKPYVLTGTTRDAAPIPIPLMNRPVSNNGLNKCPVIKSEISMRNHPMV